MGALITYFYEISAVSSKSKEVTFTVNENETYSTLADDLKKAKLIKSEFFYKLYIKINRPKNLQKGVYQLNQNMDLNKIINILEGGSTYVDSVKLTFKEGTNMRDYIKVITSNTNIGVEDIKIVEPIPSEVRNFLTSGKQVKIINNHGDVKQMQLIFAFSIPLLNS